MSPGRVATRVPKRAMVNEILRVIPEDSIRGWFHVGAQTALGQRLNDFTKAKLVALLTSTPEGEEALSQLERNHPLSSPPTLYLVSVQDRPDTPSLIASTTELARASRAIAMMLGEGRAVRAVYAASPAYTLPFHQEVTEVPLHYERRIEYTECDPESDEYGDRKALYSLEMALIWLVDGYSHAIICVPDFVAVRPVINFGASRLGLMWALPNLTEDMMNRLAGRARPRSATFSAPSADLSTFLDVRTVTMSDPSLGDRSGFVQVRQDPNREQTAGFYTGHPGLVLGGLGIARRYGRVWTPARPSRSGLVALAIDLIGRTEEELTRLYEGDRKGYPGYFRYVAVSINGRKVAGQLRSTFEDLIGAILQADAEQSRQTSLERPLLHALVRGQDQLALEVLATFDCPQCGDGVLGRCPQCWSPYAARLDGSDLIFECSNRDCTHRLDVDAGFKCDCGQEVPVAALENHLNILPKPEFTAALREFLRAMPDVTWGGLFYVGGYVLKLLAPAPRPFREMVRLADLRSWRIRARHNVRDVPRGRRREDLIRVLGLTKEKCAANNRHPTHEICSRCLASQISVEEVREGAICLPRMLGLAIEMNFDGVHHRYEIADVKYEDVLDDTDAEVRLGLHLKSRMERRPRGVGHSALPVKALYTQLFYSAHLALTGRVQFDVIGISIPNTVMEEVVHSLRHLVNELGFPLLVVDEGDWVKIADAVVERLQVDEQGESRSRFIEVRHAGSGVGFEVSDLVSHIRSTGRDYIIQGQQKGTLADHTKPQSLDAWLRRRFPLRRDTKLADNDVAGALVATGLFEVVKGLTCPDSGRPCKGLRLVGVADRESYSRVRT
jgi:hypothetical protein